MTVKPFRILILMLGLATTGVIASTAAVRAQDDDAENYTMEEVQACSGDAMRFCHDAMPDVHKIESCMQAKKSQLSKACQAMFKK
ncbi:hypothetical protein [Beijerinckia sp. L45]|uniref:hypothetical protein n=1 Tax=Beijerinckia sp. L45 TaxID=1641855 RepID=UPI00131C79EB|nr:hypothetical protein [Beijerinckia sp. L45]